MRMPKSIRLELERARNVQRIGAIKRGHRARLETIEQALEWVLAETDEKPVVAAREGQ